MAAPPILAEALAAIPCGSWDDDFEDGACHLLWKWRRTWEGGPLSFMLDDSWIADLMFFIFKDLAASWACRSDDCPIETSRGFVDTRGHRTLVFGGGSRTAHRLILGMTSPGGPVVRSDKSSPSSAQPRLMASASFSDLAYKELAVMTKFLQA